MRTSLRCLGTLVLAACAAAPGASDPARETISIDTHEGTMLAFDLAPRDSAIVFDLLGQLWTLPGSGGSAHAITDAVRDTAEDLDPSVSPDGRSVVFRAERRGRMGLWLLDLASGAVRQLTQVGNPEEYNGGASWSPDGHAIAFTRVARDSGTVGPWHSRLRIIDVTSGATHDVRVDSAQKLQMRDPAWTPDGQRIAFVAASPASPTGGALWIVDARGGRATPLSSDTTAGLAPAFSPDGKRMAFLARDSANRLQVWVQDLATHGRRMRLTSHDDVASTRARWTHDGSAIVYSADGQMRRVAASGGESAAIPFTAHLAITRPRRDSLVARIVPRDTVAPARAFLGLALSPDGQRIAAIALGKLWMIPVGGAARAIADMPFTARGLSWSPDGNEVAWSAGPQDHEDLFAADTRTGGVRKVTALNGREALPTYSPDGRYIAFMHQDKTGALRIIDAHASATIVDTGHARMIGPGEVPWTRPVVMYPQWNATSDALLVVGEGTPGKPTPATVYRLRGAPDTVKQFVDAPIFLHWRGSAPGTLTFARHDRLWRAEFDGHAVRGEAQPLGTDAAMYVSVANDGTVLYVSGDGLRLRAPSGEVRRLGWPITYTPRVAPPLVIRNARVIGGGGDSASAPMDIVIERGRIARIAPAGSLASSGQVIDAAGKFVMPGLTDLHAHTYRPDLLPVLLYFGVTTVRDQGSSMAPLVAHGDAIAAGVFDGPRVAYGGFQFYSDWGIDEEQGRGIEPEADSGHVARSIGLAAGFGAQHVKTRTFRHWDVNARMIAEAHRLGMRATGHCSAPLPLIAAGMDAKEHIGMCSTRGAASIFAMNDMLIYDDEVQLFKAARVAVVPTILYMSLAARLGASTKLLESDSEAKPFIDKGDFEWMLTQKPWEQARMERGARDARITTARLARAGILLGTGTDVWQLPTALHLELEELVAAGLTPAEAIRAATSSAARIIGTEHDLGAIEPGKLADLLILDANPLADIRNTRRISSVILGGRVVDREAIRQSFGR